MSGRRVDGERGSVRRPLLVPENRANEIRDWLREFDAFVHETGRLRDRLAVQFHGLAITRLSINVERDIIRVGAGEPPRNEHLAIPRVNGDNAAIEFLHLPQWECVAIADRRGHLTNSGKESR